MTFCAKRTWHPFSLLIAAFVLLVLPGCSTLDTDERIASVNSDYRDFTGGDLRLAQRKPVDPALSCITRIPMKWSSWRWA